MASILLLFLHLLSRGFSGPVHEVLADGDLEFSNLNYPAAISRYDSALILDPGNTNALWRLARAYVTLGEVALHDDLKDCTARPSIMPAYA